MQLKPDPLGGVTKQVRELEDYLRRVNDFVSALDFLTPTERNEVTHLIEHNEIGEALRTLAWIIVEEEYVIAPDSYITLKDLSSGLVLPEEFPPQLESRVAR